jgi:hypothetical protein
MSFFCPHFDQVTEGCAKLKCECIPGRPGCVLRGKVQFLVPAEERVKRRGGRTRVSAPPAGSGKTPGRSSTGR